MSQEIRFVLCETSHPGNIGAAARALKTMAFSELVLVNPKEFPSVEAQARASGATDVLANARVVDTLQEAVADCGLVVGASARRRKHRWPEMNPRECAAKTLEAAQTSPVALVFGTERSGLSNDQMDRCHSLVYIPANPDYSSLNLASAVQLIAYEVYFAQGDFEPQQEPEWPPASGQEMEYFYTHLQQVMTASGFLKPDNPRHLMRKLRRLFNRAAPDEHEMQILRGLLASVAAGKSSAVQNAVSGQQQASEQTQDQDHEPAQEHTQEHTQEQTQKQTREQTQEQTQEQTREHTQDQGLAND